MVLILTEGLRVGAVGENPIVSQLLGLAACKKIHFILIQHYILTNCRIPMRPLELFHAGV